MAEASDLLLLIDLVTHDLDSAVKLHVVVVLQQFLSSSLCHLGDRRGIQLVDLDSRLQVSPRLTRGIR
jgi:hypothetical protein